MRYTLVVSLLVSILVHFCLILSLKPNANLDLSKESKLHQPNLNTIVLQVGFSALEAPEPEGLAVSPKVIEQGIDKKIDENKLSKSELENKATGATGNQSSLNRYLKPSDVDITAIPFGAIAIPSKSRINGLVERYQLRVFVDRNGVVSSVVSLDKLTAEQLFYSEIETQVKKMLFMPAKKNGVVVDSFIDIALEL